MSTAHVTSALLSTKHPDAKQSSTLHFCRKCLLSSAKYFQAASVLQILNRLSFSSNPAVEEVLLLPVERCILCLHTLLWTCLLCHLSVLKGVLLDCHREAPKG